MNSESQFNVMGIIIGITVGAVFLAIFLWFNTNADPSKVIAIKAQGNVCAVGKLKQSVNGGENVLTNGVLLMTKFSCWDSKRDDDSVATAQAQAKILNN